MNESKRGGILIFTLGLLLLFIFSPTLSYAKGEDWQKVSGPWDQKFEGFFGQIAVDPTNSNIIYLANEGGAGIYKSVDGGVSWHTANKGIPKLNSTRNYFPISGIFVNPHKPTTIYSSTATPFSANPWDPIARGVFKSTTGGRSWKKSNGKGWCPSLPKDVGGVLSIFKLVGDLNHPDTLYTGHAIGGIYKTADGGSTWLEKNNGLPKDPIFGLHVNVLEIDPSKTNTLYAAPFINYPVSYFRDKGPQPQGIYKTVDGGDHWTKLDTGSIILPLPWDVATFVTSLKVSPHHSNTIYFGTSDKGIYKSTDGGNRWVEMNGTGDNKIPQDAMGYYQINSLVIDPLIPNTIYAGLNHGGVYKSNDGGANWLPYDNGLDTGIDVNALSLAFDKLFATTSKGVYVTDMLPRLQGDEASFYGSLLKTVLSGLIYGAAGQIGSGAMGEILDLLGWGSNQDQDNLNEMSSKLDQIVDYLGNIKSELDDLMNQLKITEEEILENVNDPTDAINKIASTHEDLQTLSKNNAGSLQPGSETFTDFLNTVENVRDIYQQVDNIKYAIIPLTSANAPVLNNFTKLSIDEGNSLWNIYLGLEQYFSQLLYYQMEGVNLIIETKIYRDKAKLDQVRDGFNAQQYLSYEDNKGVQYGFIETKLQPEVDNFMDNVYRMILNQVNLLDSSSFLPSDAPSVLSRANFFRIQSLNEDHYGLRGTLMATQDLVNSVMTIQVKNKQTSQTYSGTGTLYTVSNTGTSKYTVQVQTYDYWSDINVKPSSDYTVVEYDFGDAPLGDYDILDGSGNVIGSAKVQAYKDDYTVDASGAINYGHFTISKRIGALDRFADSQWGLQYIINCGNLTLWKSPFKFQGYGCTGNNARKFRDFIIDSPDPVKIYLSATISGSAVGYYYDCKDTNTGEVCNYTTNTVGYRIKLWDVTNNEIVYQFDSDEVTSIGDNKQEIGKTLDPAKYSFTFNNPSPGHKYSIYLELYVDGQGDSRSNVMISIDPISLGVQY